MIPAVILSLAVIQLFLLREFGAAGYGAALKRFLTVQPAFVRLLMAMFAVAVGFGFVAVTPEQMALVITGVEAVFQYISQLAFKRDVEELTR